MTIMEFIILVIVAGILGAVTQSLFGFKVGGFFISVVLGFIGGWLGNFLAGQLNLPRIVYLGIDRVGEYAVLWSIAGCLIITCGVAWMQRKGAKEEKKK
jgi:uncharacterized membrane protein YeaQ/YmgE (transglycosylase-associated protein family)